MANLNFKRFDKFFDVNGYTSTSANYIANKAKELATAIMPKNINFINTTVMSCNNNDFTGVITKGVDDNALAEFKSLLEKKASLNALVSWLREAIKAKDMQLATTERIRFDEYMQVFHADVDTETYGAEITKVDEPERPDFSVESYIRDHFSVKDANEYLYLLAVCSTIGQFVHPEGEYAVARDKAYKNDDTNRVEDNRATTLIYSYKLSASRENIENTFFDLQETHREYQKRLNSIKYNVDNEIQKMRDEYEKAVHEYDLITNQNNTKINEKRSEYLREFNLWKINTMNEVRALKIVIPNALRETVDYVNNVSK